jgi:hypothetical protein
MTEMKHAIFATLICALCLWITPRADARSIRVDDPGTAADCQAQGGWSTNSPGNTSAFSPGGITISATSDAVETCGGIDKTLSVNDPIFDPMGPNPNELYVSSYNRTNQSFNSAYIATSGELYQFVSATTPQGSGGAGPGQPGFAGQLLDTDIVVWTLQNGQTEVELNGWCANGSSGSFNWGGNTFKGGCGTSPTNDFIFSKSGALLGYVSDLAYNNAGGYSTIALGSGVIPGFVPANTLNGLNIGWSEKSTTTSVPEIDSASAICGFTLLIGGLTVLRAGRRTRLGA